MATDRKEALIFFVDALQKTPTPTIGQDVLVDSLFLTDEGEFHVFTKEEETQFLSEEHGTPGITKWLKLGSVNEYSIYKLIPARIMFVKLRFTTGREAFFKSSDFFVPLEDNLRSYWQGIKQGKIVDVAYAAAYNIKGQFIEDYKKVKPNANQQQKLVMAQWN
jgi:hypothetical protein